MIGREQSRGASANQKARAKWGGFTRSHVFTHSLTCLHGLTGHYGAYRAPHAVQERLSPQRFEILLAQLIHRITIPLN